MIDFENIEKQAVEYNAEFNSGIFGCVVIDGFLKESDAHLISDEFPDPLSQKISKSRDYIFAKNKFEKSDLSTSGENMSRLNNELLSDRFKTLVDKITGETIFIDPEFHGGGMHQGGAGSYLDMHADFNYHPKNNLWFRNLNILIYFNKGWEPTFGGQLKLKNRITGEESEIEPLFNRCVIMHTRDYTLHGYDPINFPKGVYRRSIAAYAYTEVGEAPADVRSTTWYPEEGGVLKKVIGKSWPKLVAIKSKVFGSSTERNK